MVKEYFIYNSNMTSFFRFVNKRASYPFGIISLAHAPVNVTDFSIGSINNLCATFSASVCINYRLPIKVYYRICTLRHIRIEINHVRIVSNILEIYISMLYIPLGHIMCTDPCSHLKAAVVK